MTSRNDDMHDAEFEDFLQGKGELAGLLQDLPQAQPSAKLDAAIIHHAERALAASTPVISPRAANDTIGPDGHGKPPSFLWRWKLPLGLAASILFAIPVVLQQSQQTDSTDPVTAAAPGSPHTPGTQEKDSAALPQLAQADMARQAKVAEVSPPAAAMSSTAPPVAQVSKAKESKTGNDARPAMMAKQRGDVKQADQQAAPEPLPAPVPPVMVAAAPEARAVTVTGSAIRRQDMSSAAPAQAITNAASSEEKLAAASQYADSAKIRTPAQNATPARTEATGMLAKASEKESRLPEAIAEKPVMTASRRASVVDAATHLKDDTVSADKTEKKADMVAAVPVPVQAPPRAPLAAPPVAATPPMVSAPHSSTSTSLSAALAPETHLNAPDWLKKIEQLLKTKRNREALEEWQKFRAVYPDFVVDQSLQKQIDVLQR
ncbi:hypothetical protein [Undibacterium sp. TJN19]|uniref:hypothetical protein n=1 Tax=Undibacterium sp. TJN19 TaxID=3413055 RepID=UPI003BEFBB75